jgi:hypothetical protein
MNGSRLMRSAAVAVILAVITAGGVAPTVAGASAAAAGTASTVTHYTGTRGVARLLPGNAPTQTGGSTSALPRGARTLPSGQYLPTRVPRSPVSASPDEATASSPLVNFNGVSSRDSQFTNYNLEFEPPDQGLCEGNGFVLELVNSAYRVFSTTGESVRGPFNVNDLFNVGGQEFTSDPRCWFDPTTQTWFATILFLNDTGTASSLLLAVRHSPNPLGLWNHYSIDTTDGQGVPCPCFGDQPRLGIDQTNLYVTADEFSIAGPQFLGGEMWAINKAELVAGKPTPNFVRFSRLTIAGQSTLAPQPALTTAKPAAEFFLSQLDFHGRGDNRLGVWAMTNENQVGRGGVPTLTSVVINSEAYANPPAAAQKGSTSLLNSGDDRMQQAEFAGGAIWGELTTAVRPAGDRAFRAGAAWFQIKPTLAATGISGASIVRQGYIASAGEYTLYPALQPSAAGSAAAVFTLTGSNRFPSAAFSILKAGSSDFGPPVVAASGFGPYYPKSKRWGDYSFAVPSDTSDAAWLATEYIPPRSSQTTDGKQNWGTRVFEVPLP